MKKTGIAWTIFAIALLTVGLTGCKSQKDGSGGSQPVATSDDPALLVFPGNDTVYKSEFEYVYQKNNGGWDAVKGHTDAQYREYLDLYINFKRKVLEAESLGLHETDAFKNEFEGYRKQLAQPYLVEKSVQEKLIKEAYERSKVVIAAAHLLIMCSPDATPEDTLKAYNKALMLRDSITKHGKSFSEIAKRNSEDPSARSNEGYLGYFSVFDMVYPFETGAFNTKVGEVSMPVRSGYGYHLISVRDRMESTGKKTAAHIIIRVGPQYSAKTDDQAKAKISEIYTKLKGGADWEETVKAYSDDPNTADRGGDLGVGRLIPEMEDIKRKLGKDDISEPFSTSFGHHILKVTDVEPVKTFEEAQPDIKSKIARDARSTLSREELIKRVKREYGYQRNETTISAFNEAIEKQGQIPQYNKGFWRPVDSIHKHLYDMPLYTIGSNGDKHTGTVQDYITWYVKARKGYEGATLAQVTNKLLESFEEQEMLAHEERQLPKKHREYRELLKEYRDGILLFTLTEDKVWRKAVEDTVGLKKYYEDNKSKFMADERVVVTEYIAEQRGSIEQVDRLLAKKTPEAEIDSIVNSTSALNLRVRTQTYEKGKSEKEAMMFGQQPGHRSAILEYGKAWRILVLKENLPAGQKSFDDSKSECITQYQNFLEAEWLAELKDKYPVTVQEKTFSTLYK